MKYSLLHLLLPGLSFHIPAPFNSFCCMAAYGEAWAKEHKNIHVSHGRLCCVLDTSFPQKIDSVFLVLKNRDSNQIVASL